MIHFLSIAGIIYLAAAIPSVLEPPNLSENSSDSAVAPKGPAGLKVVMDPTTGRILENPTAAELKLVSEPITSTAPRRSSWELRAFSLPGGGEGVDLDRWAHHSLTIKRAEDGELRVECVQGDVHQTASRESGEEQR